MATIAELLKLPGLPRSEAMSLLVAVSGLDRVSFIADPQRVLEPALAKRYRALHSRRIAGEPIAYLVGEREFHSRAFAVSPAVLIPRPETELLVELALERMPTGARVLDLGTGSGAIAVTLAAERPDVSVTAVDISTEALAVARANAARHQVGVRFIVSDWFSALGSERFDAIIANPPYVASGDPHLATGDVRFEPRLALASGADGLDAIRKIVATALSHAAPEAWLLIEHGYDQGASIPALLRAAGYCEASNWPDLQGHPRVSGGRAPAA